MPLNTAALAAHSVDAIAVTVVIGLIGGYHAYLRALARKNPSAVLSSVAAIARTTWVETMMADRANAVLAIQTLRNSTMASTFLASTSILLMVGVLTLSSQGPALKTTWHYVNVAGSLGPELWLIKLLVLLLLLFFAFFSFSNAIRIFNHVGYLINVPQDVNRPEGANAPESVDLRIKPTRTRFTPSQVASELNRGGRYYSLGTRTYYYLIPFVFWLFGPLYMIGAATVLVLIMLPRIDKTPLPMRSG